MVAVTRTHPKWVQTLSIPVIVTALILFATCSRSSVLISLRSNAYVAMAFPADLPPAEASSVMAKHGIDTIVSENNLQVPITDFVRLGYLSLSDFSRRVKVGDPRHTPLTSLLVSTFATTGTYGSWRIWYVPVGTGAIYTKIQDAFSEIGCDWAWDAQPSSPVLHFLWIIWLGWILWLLAGKQVKDRLYHVVLIVAWVPLAFFQSLPAAALMVVGQGMSAILGMHALAGGRKQRMGRNGIRRLLVNLAPFLLSLLFLVSMDMRLLIPTAASVLMLIPFVLYKDMISNFLYKRRLHHYPPFRMILEETFNGKTAKLGILTMVPLVMMVTLILIVPSGTGDHAAYHLDFNNDSNQRLYTPDYTSMIRSHTVYQEALAWGRLGEASWMTDSYTRPYHFDVLDDRIVRGDIDRESTMEVFQNSNELDKGLKHILEHTRGGTPIVRTGDDIHQTRTIQLDSLGVVFYIMALAPFCVLGLHRESQSRRRIITSYINRQVA